MSKEELISTMPIIKSAKKRVKVARKATIRNVKTKRSLRTALRSFQTAITGKSKNAGQAQNEAHSAIDTAVKKGVISKNKAARKKSQLAKQAKTAGVKPASTTKTTKKTSTKSPAAKPAAKKASTAKKPAAKSTTKKSS